MALAGSSISCLLRRLLLFLLPLPLHSVLCVLWRCIDFFLWFVFFCASRAPPLLSICVSCPVVSCLFGVFFYPPQATQQDVGCKSLPANRPARQQSVACESLTQAQGATHQSMDCESLTSNQWATPQSVDFESLTTTQEATQQSVDGLPAPKTDSKGHAIKCRGHTTRACIASP